MQTQQTISFFGIVSNSATSRTSKTGRKYTAFGVSIICDRNLQAFHYNVVAFGKQGHFAKQLRAGTRIKLVVQAQSQPDNMASIPLSPQPSCDGASVPRRTQCLVDRCTNWRTAALAN